MKALPKSKCCESRSRCKRCPIRMLKDGTLPEGLTVKRRQLMTLDGKKVTKNSIRRLFAPRRSKVPSS
ncbi:hypothetical protein JOF29_002542 [Kribbella aluminosa]|uniref:Uncharacterized protein n=1 Tax=Kribbella aluminosa TaxID=416017 RepID=A0ABS4UIU9_9ACTN|nr:hypothetical protein [Kribbella aluminosa]